MRFQKQLHVVQVTVRSDYRYHPLYYYVIKAWGGRDSSISDNPASLLVLDPEALKNFRLKLTAEQMLENRAHFECAFNEVPGSTWGVHIVPVDEMTWKLQRSYQREPGLIKGEPQDRVLYQIRMRTAHCKGYPEYKKDKDLPLAPYFDLWFGLTKEEYCEFESVKNANFKISLKWLGATRAKAAA